MNWLRRLFFVGLTAVLAGVAPRLYTWWRYEPDVVEVNQAKPAPVAIVFGAGLTRSGTPTAVLYDRVAAAAELYRQGKVQTLLMSGSTYSSVYNEPRAMRDLAVQLGVPASAIQLDPLGLRTYDTCYRAKHLFGIQQAVLVTQGFHLPRALYICDALGLSASGASADLRQYRRSSIVIWNVREIAATAAALWDVHVIQPIPSLEASAGQG
jgi:vancomycin permeability regulator SanA